MPYRQIAIVPLSSCTLSGYFERLRRAARSPSRRLSHVAAPGEDFFSGENGEPRGVAFSQHAGRNHIDICPLERDNLGLLSRTLIGATLAFSVVAANLLGKPAEHHRHNVPKF